jgi:hypothetical protein
MVKVFFYFSFKVYYCSDILLFCLHKIYIFDCILIYFLAWYNNQAFLFNIFDYINLNIIKIINLSNYNNLIF